MDDYTLKFGSKRIKVVFKEIKYTKESDTKNDLEGENT